MTEAGLWLKYRRTGDMGARNELVMLYTPWAESICRAFAGARGFDWHEVQGDAAYELIRAVDLYDPARGVPFRSFAEYKVRWGLGEASRSFMKFRRLDTIAALVARGGTLSPAALGASRWRGAGTPARGPGGSRTVARSPPRGGSRSRGPGRTGLTLPAGRKAAPGADDAGGNEGEGNLIGPASFARGYVRDPRARLGSSARPRDPADLAEERETMSIILDAMPDEKAREVAYRRIFLSESVDEIGVAMKLGKTRVQEILAGDVLPVARWTLTRLGIWPPPPARARGAARRRATRTRRNQPRPGVPAHSLVGTEGAGPGEGEGEGEARPTREGPAAGEDRSERMEP